jgi:hypothetical protein
MVVVSATFAAADFSAAVFGAAAFLGLCAGFGGLSGCAGATDSGAAGAT